MMRYNAATPRSWYIDHSYEPCSVDGWIRVGGGPTTPATVMHVSFVDGDVVELHFQIAGHCVCCCQYVGKMLVIELPIHKLGKKGRSGDSGRLGC
jgi:hypothetical protein